MLGTILLVFAFVLAIIAALIPPQAWAPWGRMHFGWMAFACYIASILFGGHVPLH